MASYIEFSGGNLSLTNSVGEGRAYSRLSACIHAQAGVHHIHPAPISLINSVAPRLIAKRLRLSLIVLPILSEKLVRGYVGLGVFHPRTKIILNTLVGTTYSRVHHTTIGLELFHFCARPAPIYRYLSTLVATTYSRLHQTTIGLGLFHFCVRNGNRWDKSSIIATKELKLVRGEKWEQVGQIQYNRH